MLMRKIEFWLKKNIKKLSDNIEALNETINKHLEVTNCTINLMKRILKELNNTKSQIKGVIRELNNKKLEVLSTYRDWINLFFINIIECKLTNKSKVMQKSFT